MLFIYHTYFSKFLNVRQSISNLVKLGMDDISLEDHALNIIENNDENIKDQKH
jgi:2-methylisocitrate lyase-like PEP mutase family enzyme